MRQDGQEMTSSILMTLLCCTWRRSPFKWGWKNHDKQFTESINGYWARSHRAIVIKLKGIQVHVNSIDAYAPTSSSSEVDLEIFYDDLDMAMSIFKTCEMKIVMGDFNAKIDDGRQELLVRPHRQGDRNNAVTC